MPKVSVIMPAYNAEKYIKEAIDSILNQTFGDFEFIILNDCSKDATEEIILSYQDDRIVYVKNEENMGVAATLNRGLELAKGEYIARMDSDDISLPERFALQVAYMDGHPECGICGSNTLLFGQGKENELFCFAQEDAAIRTDMLFNSSFAHPSVMLRRSVLDQYGLRYDCSFERVEDYELWDRLLTVSKGYNIQKPLLRYRFHTAQVTQAHRPEQIQALVRLHRKMLTRLKVNMTKDEEEVFIRVCAGERKFLQAEYDVFVSGGEKLIACTQGTGEQLRKIYSMINMQIRKNSAIQGKRFSAAELVHELVDKIRNWRRK